MSLPTISKLSIAPSLANDLSRHINTQPLDEQARAAREKVVMVAVTNWYHLHVRGIGAEAVFAEVFNTPYMAIGAVLTVSDEVLIRLRRDEFMLLTTDLTAALQRLGSKFDKSLLTLTDVTHGRGVICLCGRRGSGVLSKLCGLDFANTKFPDRCAAQTSLANARTLIIRMDAGSLQAYYVVVDRSLADYVWEVVYDAAQEWGGIVLNPNSLDQLRK